MSLKIMQVKNRTFTDSSVQSSWDGKYWQPAMPCLLTPNLWEWFLHNILRRHFSFGQPFCVVCGKEKRGE